VGVTLRRLLPLALLLGALALPAPAAQAAGCGPAAGEVPTASSLGAARKATLCLVNQARARKGLRALRADAGLAAHAQRHANDMTRRLFFSQSHNRQAMAWNVDFYAAPKWAVRRMLSRHRALLLGRRTRRAGVGVSPATPFSPDRRGATYVVDVG
jgi:hypothetical protein